MSGWNRQSPHSTFNLHRSTFLPFAFFLLLALAWTWPLPTRLATRIAHDAGDPVLNTWILWWNTQAQPFTDAWWSPPIFYPMRGALALSEHLAGIALFTSPLQSMGANAVAAYNVAIVMSAWLSGCFTFLLVRRLTASTAAGLIAGAAFGFAPYRAGQLAHVQVLTSQWMPLALLAMHAYLDDRRIPWLLLFAAAWLLQALSNGYYLLFFPVLIALWLAWFCTESVARLRAGLQLAAIFIASSLLLLPALMRYRDVHGVLGIARGRGEMVMFSGRWQSFFHPAPLLRFWPAAEGATQEGFLFLGAAVMLLLVIGATLAIRGGRVATLAANRSAAMFYSVAGAVMCWLAMGPTDQDGLMGFVLRPYTALMHLPGFEGLRVPARFTMLAALCFSVAAGLISARILSRLGQRRRLVAALALTAMIADGWIDAMPLVPPPSRLVLPPSRDAVVVELPAHELSVNVGAMFRSMSHRMPIVNGFSGYTPPHYVVLTTALLRQNPAALTQLARGHPLAVVVHRTMDPDGGIRRFVENAGGILEQESGVGPVFLIPPRPRERRPALGAPLRPVATLDGAGGVIADLGTEATVRTVGFAVRWRHAEIPERLTVNISSDGKAWTTVWEDWTAGLLLAAALEDQRDVLVSIVLPDVRTRHVRITPAPRWLTGELRLYGPS